MFAVVRTGGKQYRVTAGDKIVVEKLPGEAGDTVTLDDVLFAGDGGEIKPSDGLTVSAEIVAHAKGEKVVVFKKKRRHNYRRKKGHRQQHTILKIVAVGDEKAAPKAKAKKEEAPAAEAAPAAEKPAPKKKAPAKKAEAPAAKEARAEAPLKTEGRESEMTDTPAPPKKKASTKKPAADKNA